VEDAVVTNRQPLALGVHIGVNRVDPGHYRGWSGPLTSCENDADTMQAIARAQGFETRQLKTEDATRENVIEAIRAASEQMVQGDIFMITYAGHGSRMADMDGDEADGKDDTWCLFDAQLLDDELNVLLAGFEAGVRVLVISDSCHSGTLLKGAAESADDVERIEDDFVHSRLMPRADSIDVNRTYRRFYADIARSLPRPHPAVRASVRLLSGCQEDQSSWGNDKSGRFTAAIESIFADGGFEGDYNGFHQAIVEAVARAMKPQTPGHMVIGEPDREFDRQKPFTI
jgi:hypothetical protein